MDRASRWKKDVGFASAFFYEKIKGAKMTDFERVSAEPQSGFHGIYGEPKAELRKAKPGLLPASDCRCI